MPSTLQRLYTSTSDCYAKLDGILVQDVCQIKNSQVAYRNAFKQFTGGFRGRVELHFKTKNPYDNQYIRTIPYQVVLYDSSDIAYGIDELKDFLYPSIGCEYPCKTCRPSNPRHCTSCLPQATAPQFLHTPAGYKYQTCVDGCPAAAGYTSNGSKNPRICQKCADTCQTCAQDDKVGDVKVCKTCKAAFPFFWGNMSTCHAGKCPEGSYLSNTLKCSTCLKPCRACSDRLTCTSCAAKSPLPYLFEAQCLKQCVRGYTPIDNICVKCRSPCATCQFGQIESCLSCDNTNQKQYLYGRGCLAACPVNTTLSFATRECKGCRVGCAMCDDQDNSICLRCSAGLALLNNTCLESCPFEYLKSPDGSVCELRTYPLDRTFVVFPFLGTAFFFVLVTLASYWLTGHRSLVASSLIAWFGPIEMAATFYQFLYSARDDRQFKPVLIGSLCVFVAGVIVNIVFIVNFHKQVKGTDRQFERWRKQKWIASNFYLVVSALLSVTMYRLIYCRLFRLDIMTVKLNRP